MLKLIFGCLTLLLWNVCAIEAPSEEKPKEKQKETLQIGKNEIDISASPTKGNANAPIQVVLATSFDCPACKHLKPTLEKVLGPYVADEKARLVVKNGSISPNSFRYQAIAYCAGLQGKYWEVYEAFFADLNQYFSNGFGVVERLHPLFESLELDIPKLDACLDGSDTGLPEEERKPVWVEPLFEVDYKELSTKLFVRFLPVVFVNGKPVQQPYTEENLRKAFESAASVPIPQGSDVPAGS